MEQVAVMQNIFYNRKITKIFDLKGSLRGRFAANTQSAKDDSQPDTPSMSDNSGGRRKDQWDEGNNNHHRNQQENTTMPDNMSDESGGGAEHGSSTTEKGGAAGAGTLLDGDFLEFTQGRPVPLTDRAKAVFQMSILNDTLFLSIINVLDYSILVGVDEENMELVVGIIDFMRQYDILKQMERVGKSLPMVVGSEAPTIIQPPLYKSRFTNAMERYFMTVPSKWTQI
jgi:Phosphatidylinositol-4-phosphate 5-Kinase